VCKLARGRACTRCMCMIHVSWMDPRRPTLQNQTISQTQSAGARRNLLHTGRLTASYIHHGYLRGFGRFSPHYLACTSGMHKGAASRQSRPDLPRPTLHTSRGVTASLANLLTMIAVHAIAAIYSIVFRLLPLVRMLRCSYQRQRGSSRTLRELPLGMIHSYESLSAHASGG